MSILKLPFMAERGEEILVGGHLTKIYQLTPTAIGSLRVIAKPVIAAFATLFSPTERDGGVEQHFEKSGENVSQRVKTTGLSPEVIQMRVTQRASAVEALIEGLTGPAGLQVVSIVVHDALRLPEPSPAERDAFLKSVSLETLIELLSGIWKVNERALSPLVQKLGLSTEALKGAVQARLRAVRGDEAAPPESATSQPTSTGS